MERWRASTADSKDAMRYHYMDRWPIDVVKSKCLNTINEREKNILLLNNIDKILTCMFLYLDTTQPAAERGLRTCPRCSGIQTASGFATAARCRPYIRRPLCRLAAQPAPLHAPNRRRNLQSINITSQTMLQKFEETSAG
jgi:hypothetical protein